jgi:hypothetical protein
MRSAPSVVGPRKKYNVWVEPKLTARIEFRGITEHGLRHPSFKGLNERP